MSAISCAIRRPPAARSRGRALRPTPVSIQVNPDPGGGAPQRTGTGNVTAMFARGYIEVLFKTADTPLGRELEAGLARYPRRASRGLRGSRCRRGPSAARRPRLSHAAAGATCSDRSIPAARPAPRPSRSRASSPARCRRAASRSSPTAPSTWSGSRAGSSHPNGALGLTSVMIAVADVEEAAQRFARFTGRRRCRRRRDRRSRSTAAARARHRRCIRADAARDRDPFAALRRRLRHQGDSRSTALDDILAACRRDVRGGASRTWSRSSPRSSGTARGCSRSEAACW